MAAWVLRSRAGRGRRPAAAVLTAALMPALLLTHAATTLVMVGVIWFVQVVHYPLLGAVGDEGFRAYAEAHSRRVAALIAVPWGLETGTALALVVVAPDARTVAGVALVGVIVASTVLVQVPCHRRFAAGYDTTAHRRLVRSNWVRTAAGPPAASWLWRCSAVRPEPTGHDPPSGNVMGGPTMSCP